MFYMDAFANNHLVTLLDKSRDDFELVFKVSRQMEPIVENRSRTNLLANKVLGVAFFQSSTRTRVSFESAMVRLGGGVVGFSDPKTTRAGDYYSESLEDIVRMMNSYSDFLVIRHPEDFAPVQATKVAEIPIINAGDGYNEHPTQALLDMYTILRQKGRLDGLKIAIVGDQNMRVMHSLPVALSHYDTKLYLVSPPEQSMPERWMNEIRKINSNYEELSTLDGIIDQLDVIYLMGTKTPSYAKGHIDTPTERPQTPEPYVIDRDKLAKAKQDLILLHPLPRTDELPKDVDQLPQAHYFAQARYGVIVRMALLALIAGKVP
jgi:aspartate carbamoyltransferase catalytic subunit